MQKAIRFRLTDWNAVDHIRLKALLNLALPIT